MVEQSGLRERQKERLRQAIQDAATRLFLAEGFDAVGVADIAAAAEVSKRTLFKYFPSKEDLVVGSFADHEDEAARVVRGRRAGCGPLTALHEHFLDGLARRDPVTGLDDRPQTIAFVNMVRSVPSLRSRLLVFQSRSERSLTAALAHAGPAGTARLAAYQILAVQRALADDNRERLAAGTTAKLRHPTAVRAANQAFDLLRHGLLHRYDRPA
jgi:AcrR family transcriptional regulator